MSKPLTWNDEQIRTFVNANAFKVFRDGDIRRVVGVASADAVAMMIRDDLQRRIVELEAQLARTQYVPVPPETTIECDCDNIDCTELLTIDSDTMISFENDAGYWSVELPVGYAVCRLAGEADNG